MVYGKSSVTPGEDFSVKNSQIVGNPEITNSSGQLVNIAISLIKPLPGGLSSQNSQNKSR
jgi:hypothetical protein